MAEAPPETVTTTSAPASPGDALRAALDDASGTWPDVVLRPHQMEALDELAVRLSHGVQRTWVDAPTGSGKTVMFCALAAALDGSTLILVPRRNLADQTVAALARHFPSVPTTPEGPEFAGLPGVTISTYQAALRHETEMSWDDVDLLICDEAHTALGARTRRMLDRASKGIAVGFTATGATTTGHVEQVFGPVATTLDRQSAIERGILCPLRSLRVERSIDLTDVAKVRGDFDQASLGRALDRALWHRACAEVWDEHFAPLELAGVAYTATVAQAHALADELIERGVKAAAVSGQTPKLELGRVLMDFAAGRIDVLCNADLLTEGWDETRAAVVMHLAPTTSERVFVQRLGRVMRPAEGKEAVSVEFLPTGDKMGVQTSHEVFGMGWYKPLGRVAGPPDSSERGKLAKAAEVLAAENGLANLVNPSADPREIAAGLKDGGWREADPGQLPTTLMEDWVQAAGSEVSATEVAETITAGLVPDAAPAWWALSGLLERKIDPEQMQTVWRAWAMALITQPDARDRLPDDVPRKVLDRLRMTQRERLRAIWWHADVADRWDRLATLEQLGRSTDRRRRWTALQEASPWAPAWAWDVSRSLADTERPGRNQEAARIAAWEANHLISNGGEPNLIGQWLRAAGESAPPPVTPNGSTSLRLGQAARLAVMLGDDDVPVRSEYLRLAGRAASSAGGWAALRGYLDALDLTTPDARRALRAAVGAMHPKSLQSRRAWNALRVRLPRLPSAEEVGIGESRRGRKGDGSGRRRRRRMRSGDNQSSRQAATQSGRQGSKKTAEQASGGSGKQDSSGQSDGQERKPRRRRRRRRPRNRSGGDGAGGGSSPNGDSPQSGGDSTAGTSE